VINCRSCEIALPDGTRRCPMCHRNLMVPTQLIILSGVLAFVFLVCGFLWSTGRLKNRVDRRELSPRFPFIGQGRAHRAGRPAQMPVVPPHDELVIGARMVQQP